MAWSKDQQTRLEFERQVLERFFPSFRWVDPRGAAKLSGTLISERGNRFEVVIPVPRDWPNAMCDLLIVHPRPVLGHAGQDLNSLGASHSMHLLNSRDGALRLCHHHGGRWSSRNTFYKVLIKGKLWIRALELHRESGRSIDHYITRH